MGPQTARGLGRGDPEQDFDKAKASESKARPKASKRCTGLHDELGTASDRHVDGPTRHFAERHLKRCRELLGSFPGLKAFCRPEAG